jgi:hypothetical protein
MAMLACASATEARAGTYHILFHQTTYARGCTPEENPSGLRGGYCTATVTTDTTVTGSLFEGADSLAITIGD